MDPGKLCQLEIHVGDIARARTWYHDLFGWKPVPADLHECVILDLPMDCPYGISLVPEPHPEPRSHGVIPYFETETPQDILDKLEAHGGRLVTGPRKIAGYGRTWQVADPWGNVLGLFERTGPKDLTV